MEMCILIYYDISLNQNVAWKSNDTWDSHGDVYNVYLQRTNTTQFTEFIQNFNTKINVRKHLYHKRLRLCWTDKNGDDSIVPSHFGFM